MRWVLEYVFCNLIFEPINSSSGVSFLDFIIKL